MNKIQKVSSRLQQLLLLMVIAWPVLGLLSWLGYIPKESLGKSSFLTTPDGIIDFSIHTLSGISLLVCMIGNTIEALPFFLGLIIVKNLFKNYAKNEIFSLKNIGYARNLGRLFLLNGLIAQPIGNMLITLGATLSNPSGHRYIVLSFGALNVEALLSGCIILVISWVMKEGYLLQEDQKLTV